VQGEEYTVTELAAVITPQKAGTFEIKPAILNAKIANGRRRSRSLLDDWVNPTEIIQKRLRSPAGKIEVQPLPSQGRRDDFSGLIGEFELHGDVSPRELKVGETATLTLTVQGTGPTTGMADPEIKVGDSAKVYKDKPQSLDAVDSGAEIRGQRILKYAIVPKKAGELALPQLNLQYFDTAHAQYEDLKVDLGTLRVEGVEDSKLQAKTEKVQKLPQEVQKLGDDLIEPHGGSKLMSHQKLSRTEWAGGGGVALVSFGFLLLSAWQRLREGNAGVRMARQRSSEANKKMQRELDKILAQAADSDARLLLKSAQKAWKEYFSDKFGLKSSSLTLIELENQLRSQLVTQASLSPLSQVWKDYERLLFAAAEPDAHEARKLIQATKTVIQEVDKSC
jgi:hypothetical protein